MLRTLLPLLIVLGGLVETAGAQSPSLETYARERAQLEVRRYAILRVNLDAPALPEAALAEIRSLNESLQAIDQRYRDAGATAPGAGMYQLQSRTRELVAAELGPSWNRLMLERFPLPEQIRRDFTDDARYAAALLTIGFEFTLGRTLRPPLTPELGARDALYSQAREAAMAPYKSKGAQSREWLVFERDMRASSHSATFKREVLGRYVPLFASFVRDDPTPPPGRVSSPAEQWLSVPVWGDEFSDTMIVRGHALLVAVTALLLVGGFVAPLWLSRRRGRRHNAPRQRQPVVSPLSLPPDLQAPELPAGLRPDLVAGNARVLDLQTWSETTISWQSSSGNGQVSPHTSLRTSNVQKDRLWVQTIDGVEEAWTLSDGVFEANRGHFITWVQARMKGGAVIPFLLFNHNTQRWHEERWLQIYHGKFWRHWLLLNVLWFVPGCILLYWLMMTMQGPEKMVVSFLGWAATLSFAWVGITHWWVARQRKRAWERLYRPRVLDWLKSLSSPLTSAAPPSPFTRAE